MSENGEPKRSIIGEALDLLEDQVELTSLELDYEAQLGIRRIAGLAATAVLAITGFALLQVALVWGLMLCGLSLGWASLLLASLYAIGAGLLYRTLVKRDRRVGEPFQGTRQELRNNIRWIRHFFS